MQQNVQKNQAMFRLPTIQRLKHGALVCFSFTKFEKFNVFSTASKSEYRIGMGQYTITLFLWQINY